ncbi:unnamed protein product [Lactuca saligna]|uniref:Replication factor A C-terminal domain-containing protein n=1 Tax=Lactuca saligna TaxID=75948 RepID=A0AA35Y712_LACSI|nr:unnamed protein product [Lactuca saligna]
MTSISDRKADGIDSPLQVRILRKWKHNVPCYETWGDAIQILGQRTNQSYIESVLNVLECYTISDYSCPKLDKYQKFLENDFYIDVGLMSAIQHIPDTLTIHKTWFRFVTKPNLIDLLETPPNYPVLLYGTNTRHKFECISGSEIAINLWKDCIGNPQKFNHYSLHPPPATTVVAVTNLKPSISNGALHHSSSHATHIYVKPEIPETTSLINLFTGPSRPLPPLAGTPTTLYEMKTKSKSELLDKTFLVCASIKDFVFQNSWYQTTCPNCKDPIFKRGDKWFCSAHGHIEKPNYTYKLSVIVSDATDTISATMSETSCRKLLKPNLDNFISNNPLIDEDTLPPTITDHKDETKKMSIQMLRGSSPDNICFIIIDHKTLTTMTDTCIPTTPAPTPNNKKATKRHITRAICSYSKCHTLLIISPFRSHTEKYSKADQQITATMHNQHKHPLPALLICLSFVLQQ